MKEKNYPTPASEGFVYLNELHETVGIETQIVDGKKVKRKFTISDGRVLFVKKLKGRDVLNMRVQAKDDADLAKATMFALSVVDDRNELVFTGDMLLDELDAQDYLLIEQANMDYNFL